MATQCFLRDITQQLYTELGCSTGTNDARLDGTTPGWRRHGIGLTRGVGAQQWDSNTVTGPTNGIEVPIAGFPYAFISAPLDRDVTISGTITLNIWALESSMNANVAINVAIDRMDKSGTLTRIATTARTTELGTSSAVNNFTVTPTSTAMKKGDRLRIRVFGDDAGTMATGFTFGVVFDGTTAAASGDSYVTFTETFDFSLDPPAYLLYRDDQDTGLTLALGDAAARTRQAMKWTAAKSGTVTNVELFMNSVVGNPADDVTLELQSDSAGSPSGTVLASVARPNGGGGSINYNLPDTDVIAGTVYWVVLSRTGAIDAANYCQFATIGTMHDSGLGYKTHNGSTWGALNRGGFYIQIDALRGVDFSTLYLTDTASDIDPGGGGTDTKEAWTTLVTSPTETGVRNTAAGWTAPLQLTKTAGGNLLEWYTKPLAAFTLKGPALVSFPAIESNVAANVSRRCEIAVTAGDGSGAVVWGAGTYQLEEGTSILERPFTVGGEDLAITNGQRLRIRIFADDYMEGAMASGHTFTVTYQGSSYAYIDLPVPSLTAFPFAGLVMAPHRAP